jgi:hypothetical protein
LIGSLTGFNTNLGDFCRASGDQNGLNMLSNSLLIASATSTGTAVIGASGSTFLTSAPVGTYVGPHNQTVPAAIRTVTAVADNTHLTLSSAFPVDMGAGSYLVKIPGGAASSASVANVSNNTFVGYGATFFDVTCMGQLPIQGTFDNSYCAGYSFTWKNNVVKGYSESTYNAGVSPGVWGAINPTIQDYNDYYDLKASYVVGAHDLAVNPAFVSQPATPITAESTLDSFVFGLSGSTLTATGTATASLTDFLANTWATPRSMGALQFMGSPAASSFILSGGIRISGGIVIH